MNIVCREGLVTANTGVRNLRSPAHRLLLQNVGQVGNGGQPSIDCITPCGETFDET